MKLDIILKNLSKREVTVTCVKVPFSLMPVGSRGDTKTVPLEEITNDNDQRALRFIGEVEGFLNAGRISAELDTDIPVQGTKKAKKASTKKQNTGKKTATEKAKETLDSLQDDDGQPARMLGKGQKQQGGELPDASEAIKDEPDKKSTLKGMLD